jgi:NAD(P)-dependent dehydrogenase (short-subunit alcohol dehydrogenase family)
VLAGGGIGFAIAHRLAKHSPKDKYLLGARSLETAREAILQLRDVGITVELEPIELVATDDDQIAVVVGNLAALFGKLDCTHHISLSEVIIDIP